VRAESNSKTSREFKGKKTPEREPSRIKKTKKVTENSNYLNIVFVKDKPKDNR
jgi:hypothetical protein